jgi:hypothetical protein
MKMNLKKLLDETDNGILDDIIGRSEKKMAEPFKKKETVIAITKPVNGKDPNQDPNQDPSELEQNDSCEMMGDGEGSQHEMDEANAPAIPQEDMEMLMELYSKIKGSKGE